MKPIPPSFLPACLYPILLGLYIKSKAKGELHAKRDIHSLQSLNLHQQTDKNPKTSGKMNQGSQSIWNELSKRAITHFKKSELVNAFDQYDLTLTNLQIDIRAK